MNEWSSADLDFRDRNIGGSYDDNRYALGYQAGVVQALGSVLDFYESNGLDVPRGLRDAILSLVDTGQ
jgi:hypothetical protein